jgi:hypothetical protein
MDIMVKNNSKYELICSASYSITPRTTLKQNSDFVAFKMVPQIRPKLDVSCDADTPKKGAHVSVFMLYVDAPQWGYDCVKTSEPDMPEWACIRPTFDNYYLKIIKNDINRYTAVDVIK